MKLIDLEKLAHEYYKNPSYHQLCTVLNEAPTVKAIPIEWIKRYVKKQANKCCHCATAIWEMLEDWEKENE